MAHRGGHCFATENSLEAISCSLKHQSDIIEVDVRKSTDGILYCYHGNYLEFIFPNFFFKKSFAELKKKYPTLATLQEVVKEVEEKALLFLDIKDKSITPEEFLSIIPTEKEIVIACFDLNYLCNLKDLPTNCKKVCNGGILLTEEKKKKLIAAKVEGVELFFWSWNEKNRENLRKLGIGTTLAYWFLPSLVYLKKAKDSLWVCYDDFLFAKRWKENLLKK